MPKVTTSIKPAKVKALLPWFGQKRTMANLIVQHLGPHKYYFEGCAGSLAVLFAKPKSQHEMVCDIHGGLTNLAWCVRDEALASELFGRLQRAAYHDDIYGASVAWLEKWQQAVGNDMPENPWPDHAYHYFIASWMGRNGLAGTVQEGWSISTRWTNAGGPSPLRFKHAVDSIPAWWERLRNVHIHRRDVFKCLESIADAPGTVCYLDPPYAQETLSGKNSYRHGFTADCHERLAAALCRFKRTRIVVSYYAWPGLDSLYEGWQRIDCSRQKHLSVGSTRGESGTRAPEILLVNSPIGD